MALLGVNSLQQFVIPTYWDAATLEKFRLADGTTYAQLVADINAALAIANADVLADPLNASLMSPTTELAVEYGIGVSNGFQTHTEYGKPDAKRGATTGHMLPLEGFDRGIGWTSDFLRKARRAQIDADIASAIRDLKDLWQQKLLTRLFKSTYTAVGSAGRSMPLADGGTADSTYVPLPRPDRAAAFAYTHDHIHNLNGITQALLETAIGNLWEHGYDAPFDLVVAAADIASWVNTTNVTGFVAKASGLIRYGITADLAQVGADYIGVIDTKYGEVRVRASGRIPTTYWAAYKSYGSLDARNPLVVRVDPEYGPQAFLKSAAAQMVDPLQEAIIYVEFGVGVQDRVGAVAYINSAGGYSDPTIS
ncbi:MAG: hypothetical protein WC718_14460 [Phycisphaerales bacterium]|jgi:hypothetical protein